MMGNLRRSLPRMLCNLFLICRESLGTASSLQWSVARKPKGGIMRGLYQGLIQLQGTSGKVIGHVRPRGWHLPEAHILIDGEPATGCLVDFGLYFYHNYAAFRRTRGAGFGPFLYLPKMEHSRKAKERFEQDMMEHGSPPWTYPSLHGSLLKQYGKHTRPNSLHEA
ncbi:Malate synthase [Populus alba x Populus x berolinensis]|uniref:malate synthase n=1 Tax=Populus alba x Populus x berolinensis TaxID=444605 RepID=A0AAD6Q3H0_9ROSI|nr:Malate synthase [Populus alba x Populus x berolinensis]